MSDLCARIPWWLALLLAAGWLLLPWGSIGTGGGSLANLTGGYAGAIRFVPPVLLAGIAVCSVVRRRQRRNLVARAAGRPADWLRSLSRHDFQRLVAAVYRASGFEVEQQQRGGSGCELIAVKERERYLIRCLAGDSATVGEETLADLAAEVAREQAAGGIAVAAGAFEEEAARVAKSVGLRLQEGRELHSRICRQVQAGEFRPPRSRLWKTDGRRLAVLLAVLFATFAAFLFTEQGARLTTHIVQRADIGGYSETLSSWLENARLLLPGGDEERELRFTPEEVEEAMAEILQQREQQQDVAPADGKEVRYRYEIELHSGGWITADTVEIDEKTITYTSRRGLEVALDRGEVKTVKRIRVD